MPIIIVNVGDRRERLSVECDDGGAPNAMTVRTRDQELARLQAWVERSRGFSGWDFRILRMRELEAGPPWEYASLVHDGGLHANSALDLGTGGGERLAALAHALPARVTATEAWSRNAPVARRRLAPLGIQLIHCASETLPIADRSFGLVLSRHEEFAPTEVARVLMAGGAFVTQQVGLHDWQELRPHFPRMTDFGDQRTEYSSAFTDLGFEVDSMEHERKVAYPSLGEFVFMLSVSPWTIEAFDIERDLDALLEFEAQCLNDEGLVVTECRYVIMARKPT